jgi:hypothetical protein
MPRRTWTPGIAALAALLLAAPASAAVVTNGNDSGAGSLRQAILDANANPGPDEIVFPEQPIVVVATSELPVLEGPVAVDGARSLLRGSSLHLGAGPVTVSRLGVEDPYGIDSGVPGAPTGLGLRRLSDGVLRLRGSLPATGALELFGAGGANFLQRFDAVAAGPFEVGLAPEPPAGQALTATLTSGGRTSAFAADVASSDTVSPVLASGRTVDADGDGMVDTVRLAATERLADASGFGGLALSGIGAAALRTGAAPDDAEFDAGLTVPLDGDATPEVRVAANPVLADLAGNQLLVGSSVRVTDDVAPQPFTAVALSRTTVRLRFSEPITTTVKAGDLALTMGSTKRTISAVRLAADRRSLEVEASPSWGYATAGQIDVLDLALADAVGNRSGVSHAAVRVFASPGDTDAPKLRSVALDRRVLCARGVSKNCRRSGGTISFTLDEAATIAVDVRRARSRARSSLRIARNPGRGAVSFGDRVEGRRLRPGPYVIDVFAIDAAGNESAPVVMRVRVRR